ncbi:G-protein coupled receptor 161-like [Anneissia japonica]|uniref:G-protein coupled receptor 161-like n=1 Tax=Anneissia japonica TaxID=1529436 RepID=UPI001425A5A7|nr:G-protein coupled receptor 161-like [Anneissia japonica]
MNTTDLESSSLVTIVFRTVIMIIIMVLALVGNSITLAILYKKESLRTKTSVFVANLAIADLLNGLLVMPVILSASIANNWPFGNAFCQVSAVITVQLCLTSISTLCAVAIERYHSIVNPMVYESKMCKRNVIFLLSWTWIQPFVFSMLPILGWGKYVYVPYIFTCITPWGDDTAFTVVLFLVCMFIPYVITVKVYYHIGRLTFRLLKRVNNAVSTGTSGPICYGSPKRSDVKSASVFAIVLGTFTICWLPYQIIMICQLFNITLPNWYFTVAAWLAVMNSSCNPIIYCLMNRQYRDGFKELIRRHRLQYTYDK